MNDEAQDNPVLKILFDAFEQQYKGDKEKVIGAINAIAEQVQQEGCKLIHFGKVVFITNVVGSRMVEFHALVGGKMDEKKKIAELDKELDKLLPMLKKLGVLIAYTTMPKDKVPVFGKILDNYKFSKKEVELPDGRPGVAFYISLEK
jgi:hypothetical protein